MKITAKRIVSKAERLHELLLRKAELKAEFQEIKSEIEVLSEQLGASVDSSFRYDGTEFEKKVEFQQWSKEVLDQKKAIRLLSKAGKKIPYKTIEVSRVVVDYIYER